MKKMAVITTRFCE